MSPLWSDNLIDFRSNPNQLVLPETPYVVTKTHSKNEIHELDSILNLLEPFGNPRISKRGQGILNLMREYELLKSVNIIIPGLPHHNRPQKKESLPIRPNFHSKTSAIPNINCQNKIR